MGSEHVRPDETEATSMALPEDLDDLFEDVEPASQEM